MRSVFLHLNKSHYTYLTKTMGISIELIVQRGYKTRTDFVDLSDYGYSENKKRVSGLIIPSFSTYGEENSPIFRPDRLRRVPQENQSVGDYYSLYSLQQNEIPKSQEILIDCPRACQGRIIDPRFPLYVTDQIETADALATRGACSVAILGMLHPQPNFIDFFGEESADSCIDDRDIRIVQNFSAMYHPEQCVKMNLLVKHYSDWGYSVSRLFLSDTIARSTWGVLEKDGKLTHISDIGSEFQKETLKQYYIVNSYKS